MTKDKIFLNGKRECLKILKKILICRMSFVNPFSVIKQNTLGHSKS